MTLEDRMALYERQHTGERFLPLCPVIVRLDGRAFHSFTRGLERPFDERLHECFGRTLTALVDESGARIGYTQSDEVSLVLYSDDVDSQIYFDGRKMKVLSVLASAATLAFARAKAEVFAGTDWAEKPAMFDARAFTVPTREEAANYLVWREIDATRNSVAMVAQSLYSHGQLQGKTVKDMHELLHERGVNWNDYPARQKRGLYVRRIRRRVPFTAEEIERLPARHHARTNPDLVVERTVTERVDMPPLRRVANRVQVVFEGAEPELIPADDA